MDVNQSTAVSNELLSATQGRVDPGQRRRRNSPVAAQTKSTVRPNEQPAAQNLEPGPTTNSSLPPVIRVVSASSSRLAPRDRPAQCDRPGVFDDDDLDTDFNYGLGRILDRIETLIRRSRRQRSRLSSRDAPTTTPSRRTGRSVPSGSIEEAYPAPLRVGDLNGFIPECTLCPLRYVTPQRASGITGWSPGRVAATVRLRDRGPGAAGRRTG